MKTIYKYSIQDDVTFLQLPESAKILSIQVQNGKPFIWALHDTTLPTFTWKFIVIGTGQEIEESGLDEKNYIGTFQMMEGLLVWHLFGYCEETKKKSDEAIDEFHHRGDFYNWPARETK